MKGLCVLGSTGSIGVQALDVAEKLQINVTALSAYSDIELLEKQIRKFKPSIVAVVDEVAAQDLKIKVADTGTDVLSGIEGVCICATDMNSDTVLNSVVGMSGLRPTLAAIESKKRLALANKESLVAGGKLVMDAVARNNTELIPVDSEHSAVFQALEGNKDKNAIKKIILTASGGPFFGKNLDQLSTVTLKEALKHPNWSMGAKITIDSATMFNKGLELIEAVWLFNVLPSQVDILIHRESIIHSLVEFSDNSVIAQLGIPDMRIPIQYALTYPKRYPSLVDSLNLSKIVNLSFYEPDYFTFDCINICKEAINMGGIYPAVVNAANEEANSLFRKGKITFLEISELIRCSMQAVDNIEQYSLQDIEEASKAAREIVQKNVNK